MKFSRDTRIIIIIRRRRRRRRRTTTPFESLKRLFYLTEDESE